MDILTVFILPSIMGVQPRNLFALDLGFETSNNGKIEDWIFQIDFDNELP